MGEAEGGSGAADAPATGKDRFAIAWRLTVAAWLIDQRHQNSARGHQRMAAYYARSESNCLRMAELHEGKAKAVPVTPAAAIYQSAADRYRAEALHYKRLREAEAHEAGGSGVE